MSTNGTTADKANDDGRNDDDNTAETTAIPRHPLGDVIAEHAPYARDDGHTDGGSR